jgi:hypothetical protein
MNQIQIHRDVWAIMATARKWAVSNEVYVFEDFRHFADIGLDQVASPHSVEAGLEVEWTDVEHDVIVRIQLPGMALETNVTATHFELDVRQYFWNYHRDERYAKMTTEVADFWFKSILTQVWDAFGAEDYRQFHADEIFHKSVDHFHRKLAEKTKEAKID